jgi:phosphate:Na+ symporter
MGIAGGLALFLYGLRLIGRGLEKAAGGRMRQYLASMTANRWLSLLFGMVSTLLVQSSSASTVLLVSFAGAGLVTVGQCLAAVLGAAVGSTVTVQLIAFRISHYALLLIAVGFFLTIGRGRKRTVGSGLLGFGLMFYGLEIMSDAMAPLKDLPGVVGFFATAADNPVPAFLIAAVFTTVAQASSATIGMVLGLSFQGLVTLPSALPFVLGANVGTASTAIIASLGSNADGKRIAWAHAAFRLGGALIALPFLGPIAELTAKLPGDLPRDIAHANTLLNVGAALLFLPFTGLAEKLVRWAIPDVVPRPGERFGPKALDRSFLEQPSLAISSAVREVLRMGELVLEMLDDVKQSLRRDDEELRRSIEERDDKVDILDEEITRYLSDLSTEVLSQAQSRQVLAILFITKDLELIADTISKGLVPGLLSKKQKFHLHFSDEGFRQILEFHAGVHEALELAVASVATWNAELAGQVLDRKQRLSVMERRFQLDHLGRLQAGNRESRATTTVHVDAMNDLKRIVSHTARIAYAVLGKVQEVEPPDTAAAPAGGSSAGGGGVPARPA